jgi:hypothetical protein
MTNSATRRPPLASPCSDESDFGRSGVGDVEDLLDAVAAVAEPARLDFLWRPVLRDAGADEVLETAANGHPRTRRRRQSANEG